MTAAATHPAEPAIRFDRVTKRFDQVEALRGVDLEVRPGEVFGFLGPNGAGKTTAIRILFDLIRATSGRVTILGLDSRHRGVEARGRAAYLPSDAQFYNDMTARDHFRLTARIRRRPIDAPHLDRLIERLDLDPTRRIGALSRGNRQKVGLIAALMSKPDLIVLDEPTTGLDPLVQDTVEHILRDTAAEGATVFFSSHELTEVEHLCSRVAMLRLGEVIDIVDLERQRLIAPQRVTVTLGGPPPADAFAALPGIEVTAVEGNRITFQLTNHQTGAGIDPLIKRLAALPVLHLETHEPSLEEIFLSYYDTPTPPPPPPP